jgi:arsenite methyltransferase
MFETEVAVRSRYSQASKKVEPREQISPAEAEPFDCRRSARRHARETKGVNYRESNETNGSCCGPNGSCC